ncbi:MAG: transporter substrate-binding domain-containing protein, partial [Candidatus Sumerlaeota bacterium]
MAFLCASLKVSARDVVIQSASEIDYPPFCMVDNSGRATGFAVELMRESLATMGTSVTFQTGTWTEVKGMLAGGRIDALPLVGRTPEREDDFDFTVPYLTLHGAIVVQEDEKDIQSFEDLKDHRVGVMEGDNAEEFLRREQRDFTITTTETFEDALRLLANGAIDAVVMQRLLALRLLKQSDIRGLRIVKTPLSEFRQDFCFAVKKGDSQTLSLLNEALSIAVARGTLRRLQAEWFAPARLPSRKKIIVGGDYRYPPYEYLDENGKPTGYNVALTRALAETLDLDVEIRLGPWKQIREDLEAGRIDAIQGMFYSTERDLLFNFSQAHSLIDHVAAVRGSFGPVPQDLSDLQGISIVVLQGDIMHEYALENGLTEQLHLASTQEEALEKVASGQYDCALVARLPALYWIEQNHWADLRVSSVPLLSLQYCYAVPPDDAMLHARLVEGLKTLEANGRLREIRQEWLGVSEIRRGVDIEQVLKSAALVVLPLLV